MLDWLAFVSIPNCLKFRGRKMTVIVIGRRTICWCWETGHLSSCVGKRATGHPAAESADKVKQKGNGVSFAGSEGKDEQRGLRSMKTPRTNTPTAPFHQPDSRAYNANTASHIQKLNEPNWEQIEKKLEEDLQWKRDRKTKPMGVSVPSSLHHSLYSND